MVKVTVTKDFKDLNNLVNRVRREYAIIAPKKIQRVIREDIQSGVSPVAGKGRYAKYSKSYKAQIKGEAAFFRSKTTGKLVVISTKGHKGKGSRKRRDRAKAAIAKINRVFRQFSKRLAPVNLTLEGKMIKSLIVSPSLVFTRKMKLLIAFQDDKAEFHNNKGAAGKTVRRLLPTNQGERFNTKITSIMRNLLDKSVSNVVNRFK